MNFYPLLLTSFNYHFQAKSIYRTEMIISKELWLLIGDFELDRDHFKEFCLHWLLYDFDLKVCACYVYTKILADSEAGSVEEVEPF